jgi:hypothetical protein
MLTCRTLRGAIFTSVALLAAAWAVAGLAAVGAFPPVAATYLGFVLILSAAAVLMITFILSLLPGSARRLSGCEH